MRGHAFNIVTHIRQCASNFCPNKYLANTLSVFFFSRMMLTNICNSTIIIPKVN